MTDNSIVTSAYLSSLGFSYNSLFGYKKSGWIDEFGRGAYCKHGQNPPLEAALSALHLQLTKPVWLGGRSALAQRGFLHFVPTREMSATIYANRGVVLPYCTSVKVKRLFLLLAKDLNHQWFDDLDTQSFDLGSGCRVIDKGGSFNTDFNVVVRPWREI